MLKNTDIKFFQKNGYLIKKSKYLESINYLQNKVFNLVIKNNKNLFKYKKSNRIDFFQSLHKHINKRELNDIRLSIVNGIGTTFCGNWKSSVFEIIPKLAATTKLWQQT